MTEYLSVKKRINVGGNHRKQGWFSFLRPLFVMATLLFFVCVSLPCWIYRYISSVCFCCQSVNMFADIVCQLCLWLQYYSCWVVVFLTLEKLKVIWAFFSTENFPQGDFHADSSFAQLKCGLKLDALFVLYPCGWYCHIEKKKNNQTKSFIKQYELALLGQSRAAFST